MARRWSFLADLFHQVVLADAPLQNAHVADARFELYRKKVLVGVLAVCGALCLAFFISWIGNRSLLGDVENAIRVDPRGEVTLAELRKLDALRIQVERLRNGGTWWMHLGLYSGDRSTAEDVRRQVPAVRNLSCEGGALPAFFHHAV